MSGSSGGAGKPKHSTWRWSHVDAGTVAAARQRTLQVKADSMHKRQAVDWNTFSDTSDGFQLAWKVPCDYAAAHRWIWGYLQVPLARS